MIVLAELKLIKVSDTKTCGFMQILHKKLKHVYYIDMHI